ncbi:MAG: nicotinate (nicotinamide) nucleotide adenylyltransferase, partial [Planctomycetia bacterium]
MPLPAPRIGLFGGSFDPPHAGHLAAARAAQTGRGLERVIWMPAARSPFKTAQSGGASGAHRAELVRLLLAGEPGMELSTLELERGGASYTIDTVEELLRRLPGGTQLYLIVGEDNLTGLPHWHRARELLERVQPVVLTRRIAEVPKEPGDDEFAVALRAGYLAMDPVDLSST